MAGGGKFPYNFLYSAIALAFPNLQSCTKIQPDPAVNARAAGTMGRNLSKLLAWRKIHAGASFFNLLFVPKNQAFAVTSPYALQSMLAA
jgi:hypothetical protein